MRRLGPPCSTALSGLRRSFLLVIGVVTEESRHVSAVGDVDELVGDHGPRTRIRPRCPIEVDGGIVGRGLRPHLSQDLRRPRTDGYGWKRTLAEHPLVGDARMVGLMGAFELVKNKDPLERFPESQGAGVYFRDSLMGEGVCLRAVGDTIICAPPFILSRAEADEMIEKTWIALDHSHKALSA